MRCRPCLTASSRLSLPFQEGRKLSRTENWKGGLMVHGAWLRTDGRVSADLCAKSTNLPTSQLFHWYELTAVHSVLVVVLLGFGSREFHVALAAFVHRCGFFCVLRCKLLSVMRCLGGDRHRRRNDSQGNRCD
jgi:hypothetical protein